MVDDEDLDEPKSDEDDGRVGYKRPPKAHQFKKGRSGNPRGRRKGSKSFETLVREALAQRVQVKADGKLKTVSMGQALLMRTLRDGIGGSRQAADQGLRLMERYGLFGEDDEAAWDLSLLDDHEFEEFDRLLHKSMGRADEWRAEQEQRASRATEEDRIFGVGDHSGSHLIDD